MLEIKEAARQALHFGESDRCTENNKCKVCRDHIDVLHELTDTLVLIILEPTLNKMRQHLFPIKATELMHRELISTLIAGILIGRTQITGDLESIIFPEGNS